MIIKYVEISIQIMIFIGIMHGTYQIFRKMGIVGKYNPERIFEGVGMSICSLMLTAYFGLNGSSPYVQEWYMNVLPAIPFLISMIFIYFGYFPNKKRQRKQSKTSV